MHSKKQFPMLVLVFIFLIVSGCKEIECGEYRAYLDDSKARERLVEWADDAVFSRAFSEDDFARGGMNGPGPGPGNLRNEVASTLLPSELSNQNIRFIGQSGLNPDMVLIGRKKYQGILISRGDFDSSLARTRLTKDRLEGSVGRVGLLCLIPFE